jgi:predicted O-methyltransferase YrrM
MAVQPVDARAVAQRLWRAGHSADLAEPDRLRRRRQLDPESADLLWILVLAARPRRILEIGTGSGVDDLSGRHHPPSRARLTTVDHRVRPQVEANLALAGVSTIVHRVVEDAAVFLRPVDLLFLDAERSEHLSYCRDLVEALAPGATLVVDNLLRPAPDEIAPFVTALQREPTLHGVAVDVGHGLQLFVRSPERA